MIKRYMYGCRRVHMFSASLRNRPSFSALIYNVLTVECTRISIPKPFLVRKDELCRKIKAYFYYLTLITDFCNFIS